jgi:hypothetical protein
LLRQMDNALRRHIRFEGDCEFEHEVTRRPFDF